MNQNELVVDCGDLRGDSQTTSECATREQKEEVPAWVNVPGPWSRGKSERTVPVYPRAFGATSGSIFA